MRVLLLIGSLFVWMAPGHSCAWDSDTLAAEAKGLPDVVQIITGRFERNPPLYYQMRLQRVTQILKTQPNKFELYDDAGVASDRLERGKEAIAWMNRKRVILDKRGFNKATKEHWYRYHANLGTFLAHDWLRSGANRKNIKPMQQGRDHIKRAIQINPDAHFGREKYQLKAMEWILHPPYGFPDTTGSLVRLPSFFGSYDAQMGHELISPNIHYGAEATKGISGLILLGDGWKSVDVFQALRNTLDNGPSSVAYLAAARGAELARQGMRSLYPNAPTGGTLARLVLPADSGGLVRPERLTELQKQYQKLRAEVEEYHKRRTDYMMKRLKVGRHPDTDKTFWNEWHDAGPPVIDDPVYTEPSARFERNMFIFLLTLVALILAGFFWRIKRRGAAQAALSAQ